MVEGVFFTFGSTYEMWAFRIAVVALGVPVVHAIHGTSGDVLNLLIRG